MLSSAMQIEDVQVTAPPTRTFPQAVQRRVTALRAQHDALQELQAQYQAERMALEARFITERSAYCERRRLILSGEQEVPVKEGEVVSAENVQGVPDFWLDCFAAVPEIASLITEQDADALAFLTDLAVSYDETFTAYTLSFHFAENPYFSNKVLTKRYEMVPNLFDEAPGLAACDGCEIEWKEGKNLTVKEVKKKQKSRGGKNKGSVRTVTKIEPCPSFFAFFKAIKEPQEGAEDQDDEDDEAQGPRADLTIDQHYDVGHMMRALVIPDAILLFTGEKEMVDIDYGMQGMGLGGADKEDEEEEEEEVRPKKGGGKR